MIVRTLTTLVALAFAATAQEPFSQLRGTGPQTLAIAFLGTLLQRFE